MKLTQHCKAAIPQHKLIKKKNNIEFVTEGMYETIQRMAERQVITLHFPNTESINILRSGVSLQRRKEMGPNGDKIKQEGMGAQHLGSKYVFK